MKKKLLAIPIVLLLILIIALIYVRITFYPQLAIANGYAAKKMCSCTFIAERSQESIQNEDLAFGPLSLTKTKIDREKRQVITSLMGLGSRTAVYRNDLGCILLDGEDDHHQDLKIKRPDLSEEIIWPYGKKISATPVRGVDYSILTRAVNQAFDPSRQLDSIMTRAVVVVYKDTLVAESYANGINAQTEILGWSMTKSITSTLIGMLVDDGKLNIEEGNVFEEWEDDDRSAITLKDLLHMQSGLEFIEDYGAISDATEMLFKSDNISERPMSKSLIQEPGTHWYYSSGTTNLLSEVIRRNCNSQDEYLNFPYKRLLNPLGMTNTVMETDESGRYIGSSYCYATPRDWAKLGMLYLNQGNWNGTQLIDSSWVQFVQTPSGHSNKIYGGHFWLNVDGSAYPDVPNLYSCNGFQGQYVFIIPSYDAVVVRMGLSEDFEINGFLKNILEGLDPV